MKINNNILKKSSFVGTIEINYNKLVKLFGLPITTIEKTSCYWSIEFDDGVVVSIYDWKPKENIKAETITRWNIGGFQNSEKKLKEYIKNKIKTINI